MPYVLQNGTGQKKKKKATVQITVKEKKISLIPSLFPLYAFLSLIC